MSECPHSHSDLSKARIGAALRRIWAERLKNKRSQEKCYLIWARSIAEAAKQGGPDQQELSWDSYETIKADLMFQHLQWKSEKAKAKEIAKLRAERVAKVRAEKLARLAQQRKEKEEKAKAGKIEALARKKLEDEKKKTALSKGLKLKARLTKFHHRKKQLETSVSIQREMVIEPQPVIEKWDIDRIKIEKMRRRVSLADQIRAVKNKKADFATEIVLKASSPDSSVEGKEGDS